MTGVEMVSFEALASLALLFLLGWFFASAWQSVWIDIGRQFVFERRDEIFDMARRGEIAFDDPSYRTIRSMLEKSIRYAHSLTFGQFVLVLLHQRRHPDQTPSQLTKAINRIEDRQVREKIKKATDSANQVLLATVLVKSPLVLFVVIPIAVAASLLRGKPFSEQASEASDVIQHDIEVMAAA